MIGNTVQHVCFWPYVFRRAEVASPPPPYLPQTEFLISLPCFYLCFDLLLIFDRFQSRLSPNDVPTTTSLVFTRTWPRLAIVLRVVPPPPPPVRQTTCYYQSRLKTTRITKNISTRLLHSRTRFTKCFWWNVVLPTVERCN